MACNQSEKPSPLIYDVASSNDCRNMDKTQLVSAALGTRKN